MAGINDVHRELGELRGTIETYIEEARDARQKLHERMGSAEKRIGSVEKKQWWLGGVFAAALFVVQHYGRQLLGGGGSPQAPPL